MAQVIRTNLPSLNAQRNLNSSQSALTTSLQRLSSGMRINGAADDAAGLAIASRMTAQINGQNQAARNANDGISMTQTAEGDLTQIGENLQRIRTLAVQAANASNSNGDRSSLQKEVAALTKEVDRTAKISSFNGIKLLDGSFTSKIFQVGANAGEVVSVDKTADATAASLGTSRFAGSAPMTVGTHAESTAVTITSLTITTTDNSVTPAAVSEPIAVATPDSPITFEVGADASENRERMIAAINAKSSETGVIATAVGPGGDIQLESVKSRQTFQLTPTLNAPVPVTGQAAANIASAALTSPVTVEDLDVSNPIAAQRALEIADNALLSVNEARAELGALQNRFSSIVSSLHTTSENLSASRARIQDADFAAETAAMTRAQILQQAGTAMLAQANSLPNNVMTLLQGR